ncbi:disease resistance protein RPV1-like [Corylus avellana]|uniref:disease resistance protein RPV1-like n=1 Tax=Corylus avellana TaxID=13451 RepID=UPI00286A951D|nr:disease resistance protein RPV1-like [Corylus avellana]
MASSSSFSFIDSWTYDVFLSFRGKDTRNNFTAHLYAALRRNGINTFMDDQLRSGEEISPALLKAIEESQISIIVFSKNYASSKWCLNELMKILECKRTKGQQVLPLFYNLDPSEVRNQTTSVGEAFVKHGERFKNDENKERTRIYFEWVNSILVKKTDLQVARYPVGVESLLQDVKLVLDIKNIVGIRMVGIFGTGGVGKTTLAKAIYNSIASQFEGSYFLENIRETSSQKGLIHLQNKLLSKILECSSIIVDNVDQGITLIEQRLCRKRILLVLDDVDHSDQIEKIVGNCDWFDSGSRIIITTRDAHLLSKYQVLTYRVRELDHYEALQLFSYHAFNRDSPDDGYVEVTNDVINYAGGLPLALVVLGSALKGEEVGCVTKILGSCGIKELMDRCLITESDKLLEMHDLLQEMGREIVRQESPKEPGKRSRLWFHEDVRNVLEGNTNFVNLTSMDFSGCEFLTKIPDVSRIPNLEKLDLGYCKNLVEVHHSIGFLDKLIYLFAIECSNLRCFPRSFKLRSLEHLDLSFCSRLKNFPEIECEMECLEVIDLSDSGIEELPSSIGYLVGVEDIFLCGCTNLKNLPDSIHRLQNLTYLSLRGCTSMKELPSSIGYLGKIRTINLSFCKNLMTLPDNINQLLDLIYLSLNGSGIKEFPSSIGYLGSIEELYLGDCTNLMNLPDTIYQLQHLKHLNLTGYTKVVEFLKKGEDILSMEKFAISSWAESLQLSPPTNTSNSNDSNDGCSSASFPKLQELDLSNCSPSQSNFCRILAFYSSLETLDLSGSDIVTLPPYVRRFVGLKSLSLNKCKQLREILGLPPNVREVYAKSCVSLEIFLEQARSSLELFNTCDPLEPVEAGTVRSTLLSLNLGNSVLTELDFATQHECPFNLEILCLSSSSIVSLPTWVNKFVALEELNLDSCKQLRETPELPPSIRSINLGQCSSLERHKFGDIRDLPMLRWIDLSDCSEHINNDVQMHLLSQVHLKDRYFGCIYPGNKIPEFFSHRKEVSNTNWCEIDINEPIHLGSKNARFAFSAVFGRPDGQVEEGTVMCVEVIINGHEIFCLDRVHISTSSDHVWLLYRGSFDSQIMMGTLRVQFTCKDVNENPSKSVFLKSCGFHLEHRYQENTIGLMDGVQLSKRHRDDDDDDDKFESNWYPHQKRHSSMLQTSLTLGLRVSDAEDMPLCESQPLNHINQITDKT